MLRYFSKADRALDVIIRWGGLVTVLAAGYAWLANNMPIMRSLNWAEFVGLGVILALLTLLSITASLALFRRFRPLPVVAALDYVAPVREAYDDADLRRQIAGLSEQLAELKQKVADDRLADYAEGLATTGAERDARTVAMDALIQRVADFEIRVGKYAEGRASDIEQRVQNQGIRLDDHEQALKAIYDRERLIALANTINQKAETLIEPVRLGKIFDADEWALWKKSFRSWEGDLSHWVAYAHFYHRGSLIDEIRLIRADALDRKAAAKKDQFPDDDGLTTYKKFGIFYENWVDLEEQVSERVRQQAFEGIQTRTRG